MHKYCSENERVKREYVLYLEAASGRQSATVDGALRAIERFETSTRRKSFKKFHVEQARSFRADLAEGIGPTGKPLSAATIVGTLRHLRNFFLWLSREPGYRAAINANDAAYFTPTHQDLRIACAKREAPVATVEEIHIVLSRMPVATLTEKRNRGIVAFALLSGARVGAMASLLIKHVDLAAQTVLQDGREVRTKGRKTFTSCFFPVGPEPVAIFADYLEVLSRLGFSPADPLFPAVRVGQGADQCFEAQGLSNKMWTSGAPIRQIFRDAFALANLPYAIPHSFRKTLARLGERVCRTPEEWKAWSQNFAHESEATTFIGYGEVPLHRQAEIMRALAKARVEGLPVGLDIAALEAFLESVRGVRLVGRERTRSRHDATLGG
jgi:site-specific recombinase XerD